MEVSHLGPPLCIYICPSMSIWLLDSRRCSSFFLLCPLSRFGRILGEEREGDRSRRVEEPLVGGSGGLELKLILRSSRFYQSVLCTAAFPLLFRVLSLFLDWSAGVDRSINREAAELLFPIPVGSLQAVHLSPQHQSRCSGGGSSSLRPDPIPAYSSTIPFVPSGFVEFSLFSWNYSWKDIKESCSFFFLTEEGRAGSTL